MRDFRTILADAANRGLVLNNLYYSSRRGDWRANWRRTNDNFPFMYGFGREPEEAMDRALDPSPEDIVRTSGRAARDYKSEWKSRRDKKEAERLAAMQTPIVKSVFD